MTYQQFCERYDIRPGNEPIVFETINKYVEKKRLQNKNWAEMCEPFELLLAHLGKDGPILKRLLYAICGRLLKEESVAVKGGGRRIVKGVKLRKKEVKKENRKREEYLKALIILVDHLQEVAPFLSPYPNDELNPLSGYRLRELVWQLRALKRAELEIDTLKREDRGRMAEYAYDDKTGHYRRVGTAVTDPISVLLIYVWKSKEERTGMPLTDEDYEAMASVLEFWNFLPPEMQNAIREQIILLKDRMKYYLKANIWFYHASSSHDYIPTVYTD